MNKRQKKKQIKHQNKEAPTWGLKKGTYHKWTQAVLPPGIEQVRLHEALFARISKQVNQKVEADDHTQNKTTYLCKKVVQDWEYWWLDDATNPFKVIELSSDTFKQMTQEDKGEENKSLLLSMLLNKNI